MAQAMKFESQGGGRESLSEAIRAPYRCKYQGQFQGILRTAQALVEAEVNPTGPGGDLCQDRHRICTGSGPLSVRKNFCQADCVVCGSHTAAVDLADFQEA